MDSNLSALIKILYPTGGPENSIFDYHPFLAMLKKNTKFTGRYMHVPVKAYRGSNASRAAATAFANTNVSNNVGFAVTRGVDYSTAYIPREDWLASKGNNSAFVDVCKSEIDDQMKEMTRRLSADLYGDGTAQKGVVGSISTTTLTLATPSDARNFEVGMLVCASDDAASLLDSGAAATITAVDRSAGTLTASANWTTAISGLDAADYLYVKGDFGVSGVEGLQSWLTTSTPASLFGVTRTSDKVRLAGVASTVSGPLREGFIDAATQVDVQTGGRPDILLVNPLKWAILAKELESDRVFPSTESFGEFSFETLKLRTPNGVIKVVGDGDCPLARAFMLEMGTWELASLGQAPHIFDEDGTFDRASTADAYGVRVGHYSQLICRNPGHNAIITIS